MSTPTTAELLRRLGYADTDRVWIGTDAEPFSNEFVRVADVDAYVADRTAAGLNCWFAPQRFRPDATARKGANVAEVIALCADLDWTRPGKEGMTREQSIQMIDALSGLLGEQPVAVIMSGHGLQPVWSIDAVAGDAGGKALLDWFKAHVAEQARVIGCHVDSVFDLARYLRCPASINRKVQDGVPLEPVAASVQFRDGKRIDRFALHGIREAYPAPAGGEKARPAKVHNLGGDYGDGRVFTQGQAEKYVNDVVLARLAGIDQSEWWRGVYGVAGELSAFEPEFLTEDQARELYNEECGRRWPGVGANDEDWKWFNQGWAAPLFEAERKPGSKIRPFALPTDEDRLNLFSDHADLEAITEIQGGPKVRSGRGGVVCLNDLSSRDAAATEVDGAGEAERRSLWGDVAAMIKGGVSKPKPSVLSRTDGKPMFYARAVNAVFGDPESGKTWIVLAALAETLLHGGRAAFIDMDHNGMASVIDRLRLLGVPDEILMDQALFKYAEPEDGDDLDEMVAELRRIEAEISGWCDSAEGECHDVTVIGVDSIGELVPMYGGSSNDADDYTAVHRRVLTALARSGACVIAVDHQAKGRDSRDYGAAGSMAKKRTVDGSYLLVENAKPFVPGVGGSAALAVFKDRHGGLREHCPAGKTPEAGVFVLGAPEAADGKVFGAPVAPWSVTHPGATTADRGSSPAIDVKLRAEIVAFLIEKSSSRTVSGKQIVDNVKGSTARKQEEPKAMAEGPHAVLTMDVGGAGKPTVFGLTAEIEGSNRVRNIRQIVEDYYAALTVLKHTGRGPASFQEFVSGWPSKSYTEAA